MGLLSKIFLGDGNVNVKASGGQQILTSAELADLFAGGSTSAGVDVSASSAMRFATVWACVRLLAESIAQLPFHVYVKEKDGSSSRVRDIGLADLISYRPNHWQTPFDYIDYMVTGLCMRGNHYAYKTTDSKGEVLELLPFEPSRVTLSRDGFHNVTYRATMDGTYTIYSPDEMLHVRGCSFDGFVGVSPISQHRETVGLAMAAQEYGSKLFKNGARPSGVLSVLGELSDDAYNRLRKYWQSMYGGDNTGKTAILEQGTKYETISMSNADAQYLDLRQFQRSEICAIFRIPPHMIGDLTKSSFSNITQQSLEFVKYSILPWCVRIEQVFNRDMLTRKQRQRGMYVKFLVDGLERADIETRYKVYQMGINAGILSPNEARAKENMNPRENGNIYPMQINLTDSATGLPDTGANKRRIKSRELKAVEKREALRRRYKPGFTSAGKNVVREEVRLVRAALESGVAPGELLDEIEKIYGAMGEKVESAFRKVLRDYAKDVRDAAAGESGRDGSVDDFNEFVDDLLAGISTRHTASSVGQLSAIIRDTEESELEAVIGQRLDEWAERRPSKIGAREVVQQESAISRFVWAGLGVTTLTWVNRGAKSCPFCESLNGVTVGIDAPFVGQGNYEPDGHDASPWKVRGPKMHAPIHEGCVCAIVPG